MTKERLKEMIDSVLAWGADHDEEFRECLVNALDITDEEYKELFDEDLDTYLGSEEDDEDEDEEEDEDEWVTQVGWLLSGKEKELRTLYHGNKWKIETWKVVN